ncbi:hypothetical protein [Streptomyces katrae]|uniref:hypothetical protein n=1 Tax=Streptomyces katrae TaxID=68223 RepID=UPI0006973831|nr:hypothetical protein [Streptomyces katrae]
MALVALLLVRPPAGRWLRWGASLVSWAGILMLRSGVIGFGARAAGLAPGLWVAGRRRRRSAPQGDGERRSAAGLAAA